MIQEIPKEAREALERVLYANHFKIPQKEFLELNDKVIDIFKFLAKSYESKRQELIDGKPQKKM